MASYWAQLRCVVLGAPRAAGSGCRAGSSDGEFGSPSEHRSEPRGAVASISSHAHELSAVGAFTVSGAVAGGNVRATASKMALASMGVAGSPAALAAAALAAALAAVLAADSAVAVATRAAKG